MTKREKVLDTLEKLKRLADASRNNSQAEAEVAAAQMQKLMTEHQISEAEIADTEGEEADPVIHRTLMAELGMKTTLTSWKRILLHGLCMANGCEMVGSPAKRSRFRGGKMIPGKVHIFGKPGNIDIVVYMFQYLAREVERLCAIETGIRFSGDSRDKKSWCNSFRFGAAAALQMRLKTAKKDVLDQCAPQTQALVHKASQAAADASIDFFRKPDGKTGIRSSAQQPCAANDGYGRGQAAGSHMDLGKKDTALGSGGRKRLGD